MRQPRVLLAGLLLAGSVLACGSKKEKEPAPEYTPAVKTPKTGYYDFTVPKTWTRADDPMVMTKHEPRWRLPGEPAVELVHRRLSIRAERNDLVDALDAWKKRGVTVTERTQPIPGADPSAMAKVQLTEHVKDGKAFLGAIVDLSAIDVRTDGAYMKVDGALFELEGPEARVLEAKKDFDALVRSVGQRQL